jgi:RNA polymerase sigma-70 factor, ECF subfamily
MSIQETAALLDIRPETVKTRLHRARVLLRQTIEAQIGPMATEVFPFEDPRCRRTADIVIAKLAAATR